MTATFPTSAPALKTDYADDTDDVMAANQNQPNSEINAIAAKVGIGSSTPASGKILAGTGSGTSEWQDQVVKASGSDITTGTDDAKFATAKALADAGLNTRLKSKIITFTRDLSTASGDVSYTGVGFTPTSIMIIGAITSTLSFSIGFADSSRSNTSIESYAANTMQENSNAVLKIATSSGNTQYATVKSYDSDGFTLTWTKESSPTGTAALYALCFR